MCAVREMLALEEQNGLSEIKLNFGFFLCLFSQIGAGEHENVPSLENESLLRQEVEVRGSRGIGMFKRLVLYKSWPP